MTGVVLPVVTAAVALAGLRVQVPGGPSPLDGVAVGVVLVWAVAEVAWARVPGRAPQWPMAAGTLAAAVALTAGRLARQPPASQHQLARSVATLAAALVIAAACHFLLALPDGRLGGQARRTGAAIAYLGALGTGLVFALAGRPLPWLVAALGLAAAVDAALIIVVLHLLVAWPTAVAAAAAGVTVAIPLSLIAGGIPRLAPHGGRLLVHVLWVAGFSLVVAAVYVVIVLGLGKGPADAGDREILGLSMLAAAVAAAVYLPSRDRLLATATRFVYGAREAPDEALRTFGSRMTRAVAMDELLLQLAESLRKTMGLTRAEVYTGGGEVLERAVSVPDAGRRTILLSDRERPVVTRAGVSGSAWASIWLPRCSTAGSGPSCGWHRSATAA